MLTPPVTRSFAVRSSVRKPRSPRRVAKYLRLLMRADRLDDIRAMDPQPTVRQKRRALRVVLKGMGSSVEALIAAGRESAAQVAPQVEAVLADRPAQPPPGDGLVLP